MKRRDSKDWNPRTIAPDALPLEVRPTGEHGRQIYGIPAHPIPVIEIGDLVRASEKHWMAGDGPKPLSIGIVIEGRWSLVVPPTDSCTGRYMPLFDVKWTDGTEERITTHSCKSLKLVGLDS